MAEFKYLLMFSVIVYIPLVGMYIIQRNNKRYKGFEWNIYNDTGVAVAVALLTFVLLSEHFFPSFTERVNKGWHIYKSNEYTYCLFWFVGLSLSIFPHIYKAS